MLKMKETDGSERKCRKLKRQMGVEGSVENERDRWEWKGVLKMKETDGSGREC